VSGSAIPMIALAGGWREQILVGPSTPVPSISAGRRCWRSSWRVGPFLRRSKTWLDGGPVMGAVTVCVTGRRARAFRQRPTCSYALSPVSFSGQGSRDFLSEAFGLHRRRSG